MDNNIKFRVMENIKMPKTVEDFLQSEEKLVKIGLTNANVYNRYLDFFHKIYDSKNNIIEMIENNSIEKNVVYQIMKDKSYLIDKSLLGKKIYEKLESIYNEVKVELNA